MNDQPVLIRPADAQLQARLSRRDLALAALLILVWASNFPVAAMGLERLPPFTLTTLRFLFAAFPAILFVRLPSRLWRSAALFGLLIGVGQFGLLYLGIELGLTPTLASLVVQMQVFFTTALAVMLFGERIHLHNLAAFAVAACGLAVIAWHWGTSAPIAGTLLALASALAWALCNTVARKIDRDQMFAFIVVASALGVPPLLAATIMVEGDRPLIQAFAHPDAEIVAIVAWQSFANSLWGYTLWNRLLGRYGAAQVAPFTLPVPVIAGILSSIFLGESLGLWKIGACLLVLSGVAINLLGQRQSRRLSPDGI